MQAEALMHPIAGHGDQEEKGRYSSTLSLILTLDGVGGQHQAAADLLRTTETTSILQAVGGMQPVWAGVENNAPYRD